MAFEAGRRASPASPKWRNAAVLLLVLLAFGLRLYRLDYQSLWVDEATSARLATLSPRQIVLDRADSLHSPLYFLGLAAWTSLAGQSEFSLRFFSAWMGLLLVPLVCRTCRRLFRDERTSLMAAMLATVSSAGVAYSQEARMYAILPVAYLLVLSFALGGNGPRRPRDWLGLALSESLCLYLHVFSVFLLLAVNVLLFVRFVRRAEWQSRRLWVASQVAVGLSYAPWLLAVWRWGSHVPDKLTRSNWQANPTPLMRFLRQLWEFANSGLVGIGQIDAMRHLLAVVAVVFILGWSLTVILGPRKRLLQVSLGALLIPLVGTYAVWTMRPLAHPRYVLFLLAPLLVIVARVTSVLTSRRVTWLLGVALLGLVTSAQMASLSLAFFDSRFFRYDVRALSEAVATRAVSDEAVLMPPGDYSLRYYDPDPAVPVNVPGEMGAEGGRLDLHQLGPLLEDRPSAFLVTYTDLRSIDPRNQLPFLLETNGRLVERFSVGRMQVRHYLLEDPWSLPDLSATTATCGRLQLTGVYSQGVATADNAVTVALRWRLSEPTIHDHRTVVQLWDDGRQVAASDSRLLNELGRPTSLWEAEEETLSTHVLPVPMGTPPLTYTLRVKVYEGEDSTWQHGEEWLTLGEVELLQAVGQNSDPYGSWRGTEWHQPSTSEIARGLTLEAYATRPEALRPGDRLYVSLRWRARTSDVASSTPSLVLAQDDTVLDRDPGRLFARYPATRWAAGELLIETRDLAVPATLEPLYLLLEVGRDVVRVGEVTVAKESLDWELPNDVRSTCAQVGNVGNLIGYRWAAQPEGSTSGLLTLYWRASSEAPFAESYTVFVHLLGPNGNLLAQDDGLPREGRRPTTTWLPGEVIADQHELQLDSRVQGGQLLVGMYDLRTLERLPTYDCGGERLSNDAIPLSRVSPEGKVFSDGTHSPGMNERRGN